jgi:hypothetical protein
MKTRTRSAGGHSTVITYDNRIMTESAASPLRRVIEAPFTRRAWNEVGYALASLPLAIAALAFIVAFIGNGILWGLSATGVRTFGAAARSLVRGLLGEDIPAPPPILPVHRVMVAMPDLTAAGGFAKAVGDAGGKARVWETKPGVTVMKLTPERVTELASEAGITITSLRPQNAFLRFRARRREAHQQHLQQARPATLGLRSPPRAGRSGPPQRPLTAASWRFRPSSTTADSHAAPDSARALALSVLRHVALSGEETADFLGLRVGLRVVGAGDGRLDVVQVAGGGVGRELAPQCAPPGMGLADLVQSVQNSGRHGASRPWICDCVITIQ